MKRAVRSPARLSARIADPRKRIEQEPSMTASMKMHIDDVRIAEIKEQLERLQQLEQLERLQQQKQLQQLQRLEKLQQLQQDYKEIEILPNSVIYCDIPYKINGTKDYLEKEFDHKEFWEWAEKQTQPVYVSEYNYTGENPEKWKIVYEKEKVSLRTMNKGKRNINIEKVFWNKI